MYPPIQGYLGHVMYMYYRMTAGMFELGSFPKGHTIGSPVSITERTVEKFSPILQIS